MDDHLIPDETMFLGEGEAKNRQSFDDVLRELAAEKFSEQYDLDVPPDHLIVVERAGYVAVRVPEQESGDEA